MPRGDELSRGERNHLRRRIFESQCRQQHQPGELQDAASVYGCHRSALSLITLSRIGISAESTCGVGRLYVRIDGARKSVMRVAPSGRRGENHGDKSLRRRADRGRRGETEGLPMTTKLEKPLKREIDVNGAPYIVTLSPGGLKIVEKGKRKGQEMSWEDILSGGVALAGALKNSIALVQDQEREGTV